MMMIIYIQFYKISFQGTLYIYGFFVDLNQFKGNNSCITHAMMTILDVNCPVITIYYCFKFHVILFIGYLIVMTQSVSNGNSRVITHALL